MKNMRRLGPAAVIAAVVAGTLGAAAGPAGAATAHAHFGGAGRAVFVQTDNTAGNQVVAYQRARGGSLTQAGAYPTGGLGGILAGSVVDHLASQGSLTYDRRHGLLYAVNAGSNTVSVFAVHGDQLSLRQVTGSGGTFPVSVAVHGDLVYVLNALDGGSVQGYAASSAGCSRSPARTGPSASTRRPPRSSPTPPASLLSPRTAPS